MSFRVLGINPGQFSHLYGLSDADLAAEGAKRYVVDSKPGFPDRVEVRDMNIGEHAILLNYEHQPADTPYRSRHAIFVREGAHLALDAIDVIPDVLRIRPISLRGFSDNGEMVDADLVDGDALAPLIERFFENPAIAYLQAHFAKRGCYAARIVRADRPILGTTGKTVRTFPFGIEFWEGERPPKTSFEYENGKRSTPITRCC